MENLNKKIDTLFKTESEPSDREFLKAFKGWYNAVRKSAVMIRKAKVEGSIGYKEACEMALRSSKEAVKLLSIVDNYDLEEVEDVE